jgi:ATP/maltotriose-dependent transcriptional regulator MalT
VEAALERQAMVQTLRGDDCTESTAWAPIERPRLIERLAASASFPIVLLVAPAGYGKSIVLRQYFDSLRQPRVQFALRAEHATLLSFLRGFAEALGESAPHAITALAGAYERNQASPKRASELAGWMNAHLESFSGVIAIDDLHVADDDAEVIRFLASLIERSKDRIRWILASRSTSGLPVGSWLAYRDADLAIDEHDLQFTFGEAAAAAHGLGLSIGEDELRDLLGLTEGWPAAFSFALRTSTRSSHLRNVSAVTREMIYSFLAEQVYDALDDEERSLLEVAMALPTIEVKLLERAGFDRALQIVERLRERTAFIHEESPGVYHCHELFRDFLRHQNALAGKRSHQVVQERAGRALEASGDIEHAIAAYAAAASLEDVLRLLENHGFDLLERARSDVVWRAVKSLDETTRRENAAMLALHGALQATAGKFTRAESLLRRSLARTGNNRDLMATTSLRLAAMMANQGQDVSSLLEKVGEDLEQTVALRAEAISLIAGQQAVNGNPAIAASAAMRVEKMLCDVDSDVVRAKILHCIGIAYHHLGMAARAFEVLRQSCELAADLHLFGLESRANAVLSNLALHERDDVEQQLRYAELAVASAERAGDTFALQTALLQMLSAEMRRGDVEASIAIEQRLATIRTGDLASRYLTIFRSARLAWEGRFGEAHRLLSSCWNQMTFSVDRVSCGGEYGLFLALDGKREESARLVKEILKILELQEVTGLYRIRATAITKALCALTEAVNGRTTQADRILGGLRSDKDGIVTIVVRVVESIMFKMRHGGESGGDRVKECVEALQELDYADIARLLKAVDSVIINSASERPRPRGLTQSEVEVLRLLEQGLTPKEIAERTSRSLYTVRAHIANAIVKLHCHGHIEAIRAARRLRLI